MPSIGKVGGLSNESRQLQDAASRGLREPVATVKYSSGVPSKIIYSKEKDNYTAKFGELTRVDPTSNDVYLYLPKIIAEDIGKSITIINVDTSDTYSVYIRSPSGDLIDGEALLTIAASSVFTVTLVVLKEAVWTNTAPAGDGDAIHDNVASEISVITAKTTLVPADILLIEDSADSNNKKKTTVDSILTGYSTAGLQEDLCCPSNAASPVTGDLFGGSGAAVDAATGLLKFSFNSYYSCAGAFVLPNSWLAGSTIYPHVHIRAGTTDPGSGPANVALFDLRYRWYNSDGAYPSSLTTDSKSFTLPPDSGTDAVAYKGEFTAISGTGMENESLFEWLITRDGGDAADTYPSYVYLISFDITISVNKLGISA